MQPDLGRQGTTGAIFSEYRPRGDTRVEAGAWPSTTPADPEPDQAATSTDQAATLLAEVERLRTELVTEHTRREAAEQLRERAERNADNLRTALRMLGADDPSAQEQTEQPVEADTGLLCGT